jgi:hypothetical protein
MLRAAPQSSGVAFNIPGNIMTDNDTTITPTTTDDGLDHHLALPVDDGAADDAALAQAAADIATAADIIQNVELPQGDNGGPVTDRPGSKSNPLPDISTSVSTDTATTTAAPAADKPKGKGGKGAKAKAKATPAPAPAATTPTDDDTICGYRMHKWPTWGNAVKPSRAAILYVRAAGVYKHNTSNELAIASYVEAGSKPETRGMFNYYDVGEMVSKVQNSMPDHKAHTARRLCISLGWGLLRQVSPVPYKTPEKLGETGGRMSYYIVPFELDANGKVKSQIKGEKRRAIYAYLEREHEPVPAWLKSPDDVK